MGSARRTILIVASDAAREPSLLEAVASRAGESPSDFTLLVPAVAHGLHRIVDPEDHCCAEAQATLEAALPELSAAAGAPVAGVIGAPEPFAAAWDALNAGSYDEVIVSTRRHRLPGWLHVDLPHRIAALGVRVTEVAGDRGAGTARDARLAPAA
jgi:hypothetical protein